MPRNYVNQSAIDSEFGWLDSQEPNTAGYRNAIAHEMTDIAARAEKALPSGFRLVRYDETPTSFNIALLSDTAEQIVYYIKCHILPDVYLDAKPVTQVLLWRTSDVAYQSITSGLPELIFRNVLLKEYNIIASDSYQTTEGRGFWVRQLGYALQYGEYIYRYDRVACELTPITDHALIRDNRADLWGDDESYANILAIISKTELTPETDS